MRSGRPDPVGGHREARGRASRRGRREDRAASAASPPTSRSFNTGIKDFQTQVVNAQVGVLRGYLANAEKVRVRGVEFDGTARVNQRLSFYGAAAYTDGIYVSFPDAPPPLEETGGPQVKDISGSVLPGISKWATAFGGEYANPATMFGQAGELFGAVDTQLPLGVLVEPVGVAVPDGRRLRPDQRACGLPLERRLDGVRSGRATCSTRTTTNS